MSLGKTQSRGLVTIVRGIHHWVFLGLFAIFSGMGRKRNCEGVTQNIRVDLGLIERQMIF